MSLEHEDTGGWRNMFVDLDKFPKVAALAIVTVWTVVVTGLAFLIGMIYVVHEGITPAIALEAWWNRWLDFVIYGLIGGTVLGLGVKRATTKADVITAQANASVATQGGGFAPTPPAPRAPIPIQAEGDVIVSQGPS